MDSFMSHKAWASLFLFSSGLAIISTCMALGFIVGLASVPPPAQRDFTGGLIWFMFSVAFAFIFGVTLFFLQKERRARLTLQAAQQDLERTYRQSEVVPEVSEDTIRQGNSIASTTQQTESHEDPFRTPRASNRSLRCEIGQARTTDVRTNSIELQNLAPVPAATLNNTASRNPWNWRNPIPFRNANKSLPETPAVLNTSATAIQPDHTVQPVVSYFDPAAYYKQRAEKRVVKAKEEDTKDLMPPKIDSSFWRNVQGQEVITPRPDDTVTNNAVVGTLSVAPAGNNDISGISGISSNTRGAVALINGWKAAEPENDHHGHVDLPKRVSSLEVQVRSSSLAAILANGADGAPNFSFKRGPDSRPVSMLSPNKVEGDGSIGPVLDMYAELENDTSITSECKTQEEDAAATTPASASDSEVQQGLKHVTSVRQGLSSLVHQPSAIRNSIMSKHEESESDDDAFFYDSPKYSPPGGVKFSLFPPQQAAPREGSFRSATLVSSSPPRSFSDSTTSESTIRRFQSKNVAAGSGSPPRGLEPSKSIMSLTSSPSSTFEPSLVSSQIMMQSEDGSSPAGSLAEHRSTTAINLRTMAARAENASVEDTIIEEDSTVGPLLPASDNNSPERVPRSLSVGSRKWSEDQMSFKSARAEF